MNPALRRILTPLVFAMVVLMLLAQALGWVHRIAHSPASLRAVDASFDAQPSVTAELPLAHWVQALLPAHDSDRSCQLYDQLTHADVAIGAMPGAVSHSFGDLPQATHRASRLAAQAAGFLARGPPAQG